VTGRRKKKHIDLGDKGLKCGGEKDGAGASRGKKKLAVCSSKWGWGKGAVQKGVAVAG